MRRRRKEKKKALISNLDISQEGRKEREKRALKGKKGHPITTFREGGGGERPLLFLGERKKKGRDQGKRRGKLIYLAKGKNGRKINVPLHPGGEGRGAAILLQKKGGRGASSSSLTKEKKEKGRGGSAFLTQGRGKKRNPVRGKGGGGSTNNPYRNLSRRKKGGETRGPPTNPTLGGKKKGKKKRK